MAHTIILSFLLFWGNFTENNNPEITINISNIQENAGTIEVGVYDTGENFLESGHTYKTYSIPVKNNKASLLIEDLPAGNYAISLYHDENSDGKCNRNFIGIPKEPYAFSNNFKPKFSKPSFKDCVFELTENINMEIELIH